MHKPFFFFLSVIKLDLKVISITFPVLPTWSVKRKWTTKYQSFVWLPFNQMTHWLSLCCLCQIRCYLAGGKSWHQSETSGRHVQLPGSRLDDWDPVQLANLRMLLRSLLLYSLWSTGWTSITVTFTRLSSCGGRRNSFDFKCSNIW